MDMHRSLNCLEFSQAVLTLPSYSQTCVMQVLSSKSVDENLKVVKVQMKTTEN